MKMEGNNKETTPNTHTSALPYAAHAAGTHLPKWNFKHMTDSIVTRPDA